VCIMLRVNSLPVANKAALLVVKNSTSKPTFAGFVEFPGGMSKFTVRRDPQTKQYVSLGNYVDNPAVAFPPVCAAPVAGLGFAGAPGAGASASSATSAAALPCCNMEQQQACSPNPTCYWCRSNSRANLTLAVSPNLLN
jgi:hypothetical protein